MEQGQLVYCNNELNYPEHISKYKSYVIIEIGIGTKTDKIRIKGNQDRLVWIPSSSFSTNKIPEIKTIIIDDEITSSSHDCVEVTITFTNNEKRYATFMTIDYLRNLFNKHRKFVTGEHLIFVEEMNEAIINKTIVKLDKVNRLIENSQAYS